MKILIVEADPNRQRQLRTILTSLGHKSAEVESVSDAKAAMNTLRKKRFDCGFVAIGTSPVDGLALVKEIKSSASSKSIAIVAFSGEVTKENVIACAEAGAASFLAYPFSVSDVESAMKQALSKVSK